MLYSWIYVLLNALSALLRQWGGMIVSPSVILLLGSIIAVFYFHMINYGKIAAIYSQCLQHKRQWLAINLSVAVMWLCAVYSPVYIGASLYIFLFFAVFALLGNISLYRQAVKLNWLKTFSFLGLLLTLSFVIAMNFFEDKHAKECIGILLACLGGWSVFIYSKQTSHFLKLTSLTATQILAVRFYFTILLCLPFMSLHAVTFINIHEIFVATLVATFCLIVPIYFVQKGIEKAGPDINAIICSATPFITAVMEQFYFHNVDIKYFLVYFLYSLLAILPYIKSSIRLPKKSLHNA